MIDRRKLITAAFAAPFVIRSTSHAEEPLRVLGWGGYADQGVLDRFRAATGIELIVDNVGSYDEIFLRLRSGGLGGYSVIAPHHGLINAMQGENLIQSLDITMVPRIAEVDTRFLLPETTEIDGTRYAAPLIWGTCPAIYNADLLPEPPNAWTDLDTDVFTGKVGMQDDSLSHFNLWSRATGSANPPAMSQPEFATTVDLLTRLKQTRVAHFTPYAADLSARLASGKIWITTTGWEGMVLLPEANGVNLRIARPNPGDYAWLQALAIPTDAPMVEAAHQFIDFMLGPEEQAGLANRTIRSVVHPGATGLIQEPIRNLTDYANLDAVFSASPILGYPPLGETADGSASYLDWVTSWEAIRLVKSEAAQ